MSGSSPGALALPLRPRVGVGTGRSPTISHYLLAQTMLPLTASLIVLLVALLLERLLRLFDLLVTRGGDVEPMLQLLLYLVPHYLGLALPAAFLVSVFVVVSRLGDQNELDILQSAGLSIPRIARPFIWIGLAVTFASLALQGFAQPYSRYAFRAVLHGVVNATWNATLPSATFLDIGNGVTVRAERADRSGRHVERLFIHRRRGGSEEVTTASAAQLGIEPESRKLTLVLENGTRVRFSAEAPPSVLEFRSTALDRSIPQVDPYRLRGGNEREMTLPELWAESRNPTSAMRRTRLEAEFHARLIRALTIPLLPLLAVPMGIAAKRTGRGPGIVLAAVILVVYHHGIQLAESLADMGRVPPALSLWGALLAFALLCGGLFHASLVRPTENPFSRALEGVAGVMDRIGRLMHRPRRGEA